MCGSHDLQMRAQVQPLLDGPQGRLGSRCECQQRPDDNQHFEHQVLGFSAGAVAAETIAEFAFKLAGELIVACACSAPRGGD